MILDFLGLSDSGKSSFIAALWHGLTQRPGTRYRAVLTDQDAEYLSFLVQKWIAYEEIGRTPAASEQSLTIDLRDTHRGAEVKLMFPEVRGERMRRIWDSAGNWPFKVNGIDDYLVFINPNVMNSMIPVAEYRRQLEDQDVPLPEKDAEFKWNPEMAPPQVQLVYILEQLRKGWLATNSTELDRMTLIVSAWDVVAESTPDKTPEQAILELYPILAGYVKQNFPSARFFGISAQGGKYPELREKRKTKFDHSDRLKIVQNDLQPLTLDSFLQEIMGS